MHCNILSNWDIYRYYWKEYRKQTPVLFSLRFLTSVTASCIVLHHWVSWQTLQIPVSYNTQFLTSLTLALLCLTCSVLIAYLPLLSPCKVVKLQMEGNNNQKVYFEAYKYVSEHTASKDSLYCFWIYISVTSHIHLYIHFHPFIHNVHTSMQAICMSHITFIFFLFSEGVPSGTLSSL